MVTTRNGNDSKGGANHFDGGANNDNPLLQQLLKAVEDLKNKNEAQQNLNEERGWRALAWSQHQCLSLILPNHESEVSHATPLYLYMVSPDKVPYA